jgi:hypothetical protein
MGVSMHGNTGGKKTGQKIYNEPSAAPIITMGVKFHSGFA